MDSGESPVQTNHGYALTVLHALGTGFLEKVYENALAHELRNRRAITSMVVQHYRKVFGECTVETC
jgi:hypothetical protein